MIEIFETYGVPTFYMTTIVTEPASGGNVRIWCCVNRHGHLAPVCEVIVPATKLIEAAQVAREAAESTFNDEQILIGFAAH